MMSEYRSARCTVSGERQADAPHRSPITGQPACTTPERRVMGPKGREDDGSSQCHRQCTWQRRRSMQDAAELTCWPAYAGRARPRTCHSLGADRALLFNAKAGAAARSMGHSRQRHRLLPRQAAGKMQGVMPSDVGLGLHHPKRPRTSDLSDPAVHMVPSPQGSHRHRRTST